MKGMHEGGRNVGRSGQKCALKISLTYGLKCSLYICTRDDCTSNHFPGMHTADFVNYSGV